MKLKVLLTSTCLLLAFLFVANAENPPVLKWMVRKPFERKVFIENKGQFALPDENVKPGDVAYGASLYGLQYYFTNNTVWIRYETEVKRTAQEMTQLKAEKKIPGNLSAADESKMQYKYVPQTHEMSFVGANPAVTITCSDKVSDYYTYGSDANSAIKAYAYKKITYNNIYDGIDIVFYFPEDKEGFEYDVIVHPGADPSQVKIQYPLNEGVRVDENGNVVIKSAFGDFTDHAPTANELQLQNNKPIATSFTLKNGVVQFNIANYNKNNELKIDPFVGTPTFAHVNSAYRVDFDHGSNCYIYGGKPAWQVSKYTNNGVLDWTYTEDFGEISFIYLGDMAVDRVTQSVYLTEGFDENGAEIIKLNSGGSPLIKTAPDANLIKMWLISFSRCVAHQGVVGGGTTALNSTSFEDAFVINPSDSSLAAGSINVVNVENSANPFNDACILALDNTSPNPNCFMAMSRSLHTSNFSNDLFGFATPFTGTQLWKVSDGYNITDAASVYFGTGTSGAATDANGFHGASYGDNNDLFTYDGWVLKKWNDASGALVAKRRINFPPKTSVPPYDSGHVYWDGLSADICDHIFLGSWDTIRELDGNLANVAAGTFIQPGGMADTIFDVMLGNHYIVYACGAGFVEAIQENLTQCIPFTMDTASTNVTCTTPGTITITQSASQGVAPYTIQLIDSTTNSIVGTHVGVTSATFTGLALGYYKAIITDTSCMAQRIHYVFHITNNITYSKGTVAPNPGKMCLNTSVVLTGSNATSYTWLSSTLQKSATLSDSTGTTITANPTVTTTYVFIGRTTGDCPDTVRNVVVVNPLPHIDVTPFPAQYCTGGSVNLTATLTANNPGTYTWTPPTGLNKTTGASVTANPVVTSTYTVTAIDANGCTNDTTVVVTVNPYPVITFVPGPDTESICSGASATLQVTGATRYTWAPLSNLTDTTSGASFTVSPTGTTTYVASGTTNGCTDTAHFTLTVLPLPNVAIVVLQPTTFCIDALPVALTGSTPTGGTYSGPGISDTTFTPSSLAAGGPYTIVYTYTDGHGCTNSSSENVNIAPLPIISTTPNSKVICSGNPITISAHGADSYTWAPPTDLNVNDSIATADPTTPTQYTVTGTDGNGCVNDTTFTVNIGVLPHPTFIMTIPNQCNSLDVQFINFDTVSNTTYIWNFGDTTAVSNAKSPQHIFAQGGTYLVKLTEINAAGCIDSIDSMEHLISVTETAVLPNAFVPNGKDQINAFFGPRIECNGAVGYVFRIYNRWGQLIFESNNPSDPGWDGTFNGKPEPLDVYVYYLDFTCGNCPISRKGNITLIR